MPRALQQQHSLGLTFLYLRGTSMLLTHYKNKKHAKDYVSLLKDSLCSFTAIESASSPFHDIQIPFPVKADQIKKIPSLASNQQFAIHCIILPNHPLQRERKAWFPEWSMKSLEYKINSVTTSARSINKVANFGCIAQAINHLPLKKEERKKRHFSISPAFPSFLFFFFLKFSCATEHSVCTISVELCI